MASVLVTVLVLGMFIPVVQATTGAANDVRGRVLVNVYLKTTAKQGDVDRVKRMLDDKVAHVGSYQYVSKNQALAEQRRRYPEAYDLLGSTRCRTRSASRPTSRTTRAPCATRSRRRRRAAAGRRSTPRSTR